MKAEDFVSGLRESQLFTETEIDNIAIGCRGDRTIGAVIEACKILDIGLIAPSINHLMKCMNDEGELILTPAVRKRITEKALEYDKQVRKLTYYDRKIDYITKVQGMLESASYDGKMMDNLPSKKVLEILEQDWSRRRQECIDWVEAFTKEAKA
jgi:hypothetical protein